jgi:hypothetical protein
MKRICKNILAGILEANSSFQNMKSLLSFFESRLKTSKSKYEQNTSDLPTYKDPCLIQNSKNNPLYITSQYFEGLF